MVSESHPVVLGATSVMVPIFWPAESTLIRSLEAISSEAPRGIPIPN